MKYQNKVNYGAAVLSMHPRLIFGKDYSICNLGDMYQDIIWHTSDVEKPSKETLEREISKLKRQYYAEFRKEEYPSIEELVEAFIQKELDGQPEKWIELSQKRIQVKQRNPK